MRPSEIAAALARESRIFGRTPAFSSPLSALAELVLGYLESHDAHARMHPGDPQSEAVEVNLRRAENRLRIAVGQRLSLEAQIIEALPFVGADHRPPPDWQAKVHARIDAGETARRRWWRRLVRWWRS